MEREFRRWPEGLRRGRSALFSGLFGLAIDVLLAGWVAASAAAEPPYRHPAKRVTGLRGVENVGRVTPGIYRGSAPSEAGLDSLKALGIRTVVSLRHYHGSREEAGCRRRNLGYLRIILESSEAPSDDDVRSFLAVVTDTARQPVYVHCWRGKDRTGAMIAAYRMAVEGWSQQEALAEMDAYGFYKGWHELRSFVTAFADRSSLFWPLAPSPSPAPATVVEPRR